MSDQGFTPPPAQAPPLVAPVQPPGVPLPPPAYSEYAPAPAPQPAPPRRSRAWIGWTIGVLVFLVFLLGSCTLPFVLLSDGAGELTGFGESVGVIRLDGVIAGTGEYYSGYVTPEYFADRLERAVEDDSVKAIVLRVDSPGGTVAASEEIATYVAECEKPIIVSSGDVNASGAYMVSSQADKVFALPGTAVGSIGVIAQIPNVSGLMEKVGVEFTVVTAGKYKDAGSMYRPLTKEERALIQGEVDEAYGQFIDIVASGRDMSRSEVTSLAIGWTWSGEKAKVLGLVDEIGTYRDALDAAADAGGIDGDYEVITYEDEFEGLLGSLVGLSAGVQRLATFAGEQPAAGWRAVVPK